MSEKTLVKKLAAVMLAVTHVPKDGTNKAQGYKFTQAADVLHVIRTELAKRNVIIVPTAEAPEWHAIETKNGAVQVMTVRVSFIAHDGDSGESMPAGASIGEGMDYGDKHAPKSQTNAMKYGLLDLFLVPQGEDPEADEETDHRTMPSAASVRPDMLPTPARAPAPRQAAPPASGLTFPFGKSKGQPIAGADLRTLQFFASRALATLEDPSKERFHNQERQLLAAYNAEMAKHNGPDHGDQEQDVSF